MHTNTVLFKTFRSHVLKRNTLLHITGGCSQTYTRKNGITIVKVTRCAHSDCPAKKDPSVLYPDGKRPEGKVIFIDATTGKKIRAATG